MKVVALLSGGKDSIYNVMKCIEYGHQIVCVGNLRPAAKGVDELDSEMYQTVGWNGVELIAKAMDLPFYYIETRGKSTQNTVSYDHSNASSISKHKNDGNSDDSDEVEDMFHLLQNIKTKHPEITAVSTGAILSNYQRNRVESVCERLGLVNLAFLWQRNDQSMLLKEMVDHGIDAVIIKCASMGLSPQRFLGKSIADQMIYDELNKLGDSYGMNVCGEGGEYETFVIDCPLFRKFKISIDESSICGNLEDPICPSGHLKFEKLSLISKDLKEVTVEMEVDSVQNQDIHDVNSSVIEETKNDDSDPPEIQSVEIIEFNEIDDSNPLVAPQVIETTNICNYGHNGCFHFVSHPNVSLNSKYVADLDLQTEVDLLFGALEQQLHRHHLTMDHLFYCQLFLNEMSLFSTVNPFYKSHFKNLHPPSRVCCQMDLTQPHRVSLEALGFREKVNEETECMETDKTVFECLHVQSVSEWAPSCIGPYSQASKLRDKLVFTAGMIGLDAATMTMIGNDRSKEQIECTFNNMQSVLTAFDSSMSLAVHHNIFVLAVPQKNGDNAETQNMDLVPFKRMDHRLSNMVQCALQQHTANLEDVLDFNAVILFVPDLPKHALVEIQTLALTKRCISKLNALKMEKSEKSETSDFTESESSSSGLLQNGDSSRKKRKIKLKYAHIKRTRKRRRKPDAHSIIMDRKENEIGTFFVVKTRTVYNLYDRWCSVVSLCELTSVQSVETILSLLKSALSQSVLCVNGYGHMIGNGMSGRQRQRTEYKDDDDPDDVDGDEEESNGDWTERSIVFLRLYYHCEILEPLQLLELMESCFEDLDLCRTPAISLIPCRGLRFADEQHLDDSNDDGFGLYMLHCLLLE